MNRLANVRRGAPFLLALLCALIPVSACVPVGGTTGPAVNVSVRAHNVSPQPCENRFVAHTLDHTTSIEVEHVRTYDSNGTG
ncbi:MAG: hypothetical protein F4047_10750, partial [Caldilineaceae bacterium SB0670_bin_27]|nr:hypothetical protein [Caldilineaceae bacterium SB0670_bin_27]